MEAKKEHVMLVDTNERQRQYVEEQKAKNAGLGLVFADAFLRGMRDIGYKNPAWAIAEMVDNSFQAGATTAAIRFGFEPSNTSQKKPDMVAVCDDGNGMIPEMISYAVRWGGTDREDDRTGFGRYGYGLPSSAVSMAKRYTVYSKARSEDWHAVTVDIEKLADTAGDVQETQRLLAPYQTALPDWLLSSDDGPQLDNIESGTAIVLEDLDRLGKLNGWITISRGLRPKLLQHMGVIYRHWLPERQIWIHGKKVQPVDPLFLMEYARYYDATPIRAERVETKSFQMETSRGTTGTVRIRASVLPLNFALIDPSKYPSQAIKNRLAGRFDVMKAYNGVLICREHRQIDTIQPPFATFQNNDRYIKIEIDFDPELDEYFGITTTKQQIAIDDDLWQQLQQDGNSNGGLVRLVRNMRKRWNDIKSELDAQVLNTESAESPRPSAVAMEESAKFKDIEFKPTQQQWEEGQRNLEWEADERSRISGIPKGQVLQELMEHTSQRKWEIEYRAMTDGPFYIPKQLGEQKRMIINTDHPFYDKIYMWADDVRSALEVLLFVLAERELESFGEANTFYRSERVKWSERLRYALDSLTPDEAVVDRSSAIAEQTDMEVELGEEA